ncbi:MAG TPA: polyprenyl synthetase family protein, partial [Terrimesophilobacter sp.]|nr:polyprenyl synthetase family protein [Terrimesophilobacter sp.]
MSILIADQLSETSVRLVSAELDRIFSAKAAAAGERTPLGQLWRLAAARTHGGKYVRPLTFLSTLESLSPGAATSPQPATLVRLAAALELLHYSFLLHDDVIDGDTVRRGRPNLIGQLAAEHSGDRQRALHWARSCAILMGDLLLAEVHQLIARVDLTAPQRTRALDLIAHALTDSVAGELLDVGMSDRVIEPNLATTLDMCRLKTATYSFELPLRLAAALIDAPPEIEQALAAAGRHLGIAYQLRDDLLSTFSDASAHGKDAFSDLREGKETAVIAYARMTSRWALIEPHFGSVALTEATGLEVRRILTECGAHSFVSGLIDDELRAFREVLATSDLPQPA